MTIVVLSPHIGDAALSCFAAMLSGGRVLSIYCGLPGADAPLTGWDRDSGFSSAQAHARARLAEDETVMHELGIPHERWGYVNYLAIGYGPRPTLLELSKMLVAATTADDLLLAPVATLCDSPHPDHLDVRAAALATGRRVRLYGDVQHCVTRDGRWPRPIGEADPPDAWVTMPSGEMTVYSLTASAIALKASTMRLYRSQFRTLDTLDARRVLRRPEVYGVEVTWEAP